MRVTGNKKHLQAVPLVTGVRAYGRHNPTTFAHAMAAVTAITFTFTHNISHNGNYKLPIFDVLYQQQVQDKSFMFQLNLYCFPT